jgi:hypothetical protein
MLLPVAAFLALLVAGAAAQSPAPEPSPSAASPADDPVPAPPRQRLEDAIRAYQAGRAAEARIALAMLINEPADIPADLRQDARVYLGEVLYVAGEEDAAFRTFEQVLVEDSTYRIDPFRHPPDVCGFFEVVRASTVGLAPPPPVPAPAALPASAWVGFGVYQRGHGRPGRANAFLAGQALLGAGSILAFGLLVADRRYLEDDPAELRQLQVLRAVQWASTAGFWGLHLWGALDARHDFRQAARQAALGGPGWQFGFRYARALPPRGGQGG